MNNTSETNFKILLLLFFGLFNSVLMEAADEDLCDASDEALVQWYDQVYNFVTTNQNITQQTTNMQAKLETNMREIYNKLEEKFKIQIVQQENKMQETQAKIEDSIQEMYKKMEEILKSQLLQQENQMKMEEIQQENQLKLEEILKSQLLQQDNQMKMEEILKSQLIRQENQMKMEEIQQENQLKLEDILRSQLIRQEMKMEEIQQENQLKLEEILTSQLLQQENQMKMEEILKSQLVQQEHRMQEMNNKLESNLTTQLLQEENLEIQQTVNNDIVIQRRMDGSVDFERTWQEYREGFGNKSGEFFIGLDILHNLTSSRRYELWIDLQDWENDRRHAKYDHFVIGSEAEKYAMKSLGGYSGTAGDSLRYHLGQPFSTTDQDNDGYVDAHCAVKYTGAWWYKSCHHSNLNGRYLKGQTTSDAVSWYYFKGFKYSLKFVEMKLHPH